MKYKEIKEGVFLARPNRFLANALIDGELQTIHVKTTGRCRELLREGVRIFVEDNGEDLKMRKTRYSLVAVEKNEAGAAKRLVNIDSQAPNKVVGEALADGSVALPGFVDLPILIKPETTFGNASRFDFYAEDREGHKAFIEVKGVTLEENGIARFPDAPTERGVRHIKELCRAVEQGFAAFIIFVIQMKGVHSLEPNDKTHPAFGEALREAQDKGVVILAYDCTVAPGSMIIDKPVSIKL